MATWLNEYDVEEATGHARAEGWEVTTQAAEILERLVEWTNRNSDGWPYWPKPSRAAGRLQEQLHLRFFSAWDKRITEDMTPGELALVLRPIKAFLTRHGASIEDRRFILEGAA